MALIKKVMKAPNEILPFNHSVIHYPQLGSVKYDGFRCLNLCGERLLSPALKEIPNCRLPLHLHNFLTFCQHERIVTDGELWSPELEFNELSSIIRSYKKEIPEHVTYYIFDAMYEKDWDGENEISYWERLKFYLSFPRFPHIQPVMQDTIVDAAWAEDKFNEMIEAGGEGIILRSPNALYKHNRCTINEDGMWKFKQFVTHDAVIVNIEEQMKMKVDIARTRNEVGELEREHSQSLFEPAGMVGAFVVNWEGQLFKVKPGKGFTHAKKQVIWNNRSSYIGKHIEFKYMPHGTKDKPRIGSLVRFRNDLD